MTNDVLDEARELVAGRRRVGFEGPTTPSPATPAAAGIPLARVESIVAKAVRRATEDFARKIAAASDDLKKRAADDGLAAAREHGRHVGERLVKAAAVARERAAVAGAPAIPARAIVDSSAERDRLRALAKANGWVGDVRLKEAEQAAEALAEPVPRAPLLPAPEKPVPAPWGPHAGDAAANAAAATTAGATVEEVQAALRDGSEAWLTRLTERGALDAVRGARRLPLGKQGLDRLDQARQASQA